MLTAICSAIGSLLGVISIILNIYMAGKEKREKKAREEEIQQGRQDIVGGNVDAVERRIDKLLSDKGNSPAGK